MKEISLPEFTELREQVERIIPTAAFEEDNDGQIVIYTDLKIGMEETRTVDPRKLLPHEGHWVVVVTYGAPPVNVAVECEDCSEVLVDADIYEEDET